MLISACVKSVIIIRRELDSEDWVIASVSKAQTSLLLPIEDLNAKSSIHANRDEFLAICRKDDMKYAARMSCIENRKRLQTLGIPDMNLRINIDFASCNDSEIRMSRNSRNLQFVPLIEALDSFCGVENNCDP